MSFSLASLQRTAQSRRASSFTATLGRKTTFAVCAPAPVVIQTEDGLGNLDATAFPLAATFDDVMSAQKASTPKSTRSRPSLWTAWTGWSRWYGKGLYHA